MLLELRNVSKRFGGLTAIKDVSLRIEPHAFVGLIGPNGAGKTTLFNVITGVYAPSSGSIWFAGQEITRRKPHAICAQGLTRTFQVVKPFGNLSVLVNVMVGCFAEKLRPAEARERARHLVAMVGLENFCDVPARTLPIGLRKRLEVARALATNPRLLLLDEVMGGLNPTEVKEMIALLHRLHQEGITFLMIEHVLPAVMALCQRVVVLHYGEKIAEGSPAEITRDRRVIEAYLGEGYRVG